MKEVTFTLLVTARIDDQARPEDVYFDVDPGWVQPRVDGEAVGYTTKIILEGSDNV